ncbi:ATP-binding protein [Streptomyces sp. RY43-2]|uniref:ATP-binding protein n=1 Tax=Streptomyces macrolidinus TaxID=2952607 RepID=A0ABT0ZLP0_9ACTN|nr:ATP-binding protein [Streptomyces macrolidinus]MCN9244510.1 ATP-binding protein [Streptomyces macrolidinus]
MTPIVTQAAAVGHPGYSSELPRVAEAVSDARRLVRSALDTWGLAGIAEDTTLAVSELAANAVRHGSGRRMVVRVTRLGPNRVRVAVSDRSKKSPYFVKPSESEIDTAGRGLYLVEAVSDRWGTDLLPWGKRVWSEHVGERDACATRAD